MLSLFVLVACTYVAITDAQCYNGWILFGSSCYGFGEEFVSWAGASALCRIFDGTLAEIETEEENNFLKEHARNRSYASLWIGATDIFSEGYWIWSESKTPVQEFVDWAVGEPNHAGGESYEDCMEIYAHKGYRWNDEDCRNPSPFVCEVRLEE